MSHATGAAPVMKHRPSATALRVAMRRASHQVLDRPVVFEDPLALAIIGKRRADLVRSGDPREQSGLARSLRAFLAARSRYALDSLEAAAARGVRQYVILGAGLDTSAYRAGLAGLRCFEVDQPETQAWKRKSLTRARIAVPTTLSFVPLDFETQTLADGLRDAGFDAGRPAFFSWLGVVPYLRKESVRATLAMIAALPPGSAVVFDYGIPPSRLALKELLVTAYLARRVAAAGEPWRTFFDPGELAGELRTLGFQSTEDLGPAEINDRYFAGRSDGLSVRRVGHLVKAET
ncbi:MAG TPA: class I SAM-dependent methyltransferase [Thermoanaerobaculia bacterium]|nr:class I SAM-dependent methyltransferase [Thermoanaerobaculia bacterium]